MEDRLRSWWPPSGRICSRSSSGSRRKLRLRTAALRRPHRRARVRGVPDHVVESTSARHFFEVDEPTPEVSMTTREAPSGQARSSPSVTDTPRRTGMPGIAHACRVVFDQVSIVPRAASTQRARLEASTSSPYSMWKPRSRSSPSPSRRTCSNATDRQSSVGPTSGGTPEGRGRKAACNWSERVRP
jgi:hypothetical protein